MPQPSLPTAGQLGIEYARYSTDGQDSLVDQHEINRESAEDIDVVIVASFEDEAVSRAVTDRKGIGEMLAYLESHPRIQHLFVPQLDRLVGTLGQHVTMFRMLSKAGIRLWTSDGELDYTDDDARTRSEQDSLGAAVESRKARKRTRRHLRQKARSGRYTSRPPFGLNMKPLIGQDGIELPPDAVLLDDKGRVVRSGQLAIDLTQYGEFTAIEWLHQIFEWTANGVGNVEIRRALEAAGVPTKNGLLKWHSLSIRRIIENRTYLGEHTWGSTRVVHTPDDKKTQMKRDPEHRDIVRGLTNLGPVIDLDLFMRANQVISDRDTSRERSPRPTGQRQKAPRTLHRLVYCGRCGGLLKCQQDRKADRTPAETWRYVCPNRHSEATSIGQGGVVRRHCVIGHSLAETDVLNALAGLDPKASETEWIIAQPPTEEEKKTETEISKLELAIDEAGQAKVRIGDGFDAGMYDLATAQERTAKQDAIISAHRTQIVTLRAQAEADPQPAASDVKIRVTQAMRIIVDKAREDHGTVARTSAVRDLLRADIASTVKRIEVDAPNIRILLHPGASTAA